MQNMLVGFKTTIYELTFKGIVHFEMNVWYVSAYLKGIQDVQPRASKKALNTRNEFEHV